MPAFAYVFSVETENRRFWLVFLVNYPEIESGVGFLGVVVVMSDIFRDWNRRGVWVLDNWLREEPLAETAAVFVRDFRLCAVGSDGTVLSDDCFSNAVWFIINISETYINFKLLTSCNGYCGMFILIFYFFGFFFFFFFFV